MKQPCPGCGHPFLVEHYTKKEGASIRCPNKCGYESKPAENAPPSTATTS